MNISFSHCQIMISELLMVCYPSTPAAPFQNLTISTVYVGGHVFHDVVNLDNQVLVFKIKIPSGSKPYVGK
jgi:hypothetical protein